MRFLRLAGCFALVLGVFLFSPRLKSAPQSDVTRLQSEFIASYRQAHDSHDIEAMRKLYCWDGVTPEARASVESLGYEFEEKIVSVKLTTEHPTQRKNSYIKSGITYRFNLPVVLELRVEFEPFAKGSENASYYPVGLKEGKYRIAVMAPQSGEVQGSPGSVGQEGPVGPPSLPARAIEKSLEANPDALPARTVVIVRLNETVGVKLLEKGGVFTATVGKDVRANGGTIIPAGSVVRGSVSKYGEYSPELTLHSVTVNGSSHSIHSSTMSFNEKIEFPAETELRFELFRPFDR